VAEVADSKSFADLYHWCAMGSIESSARALGPLGAVAPARANAEGFPGAEGVAQVVSV
jgi:hypothetical protein